MQKGAAPVAPQVSGGIVSMAPQPRECGNGEEDNAIGNERIAYFRQDGSVVDVLEDVEREGRVEGAWPNGEVGRIALDTQQLRRRRP